VRITNLKIYESWIHKLKVIFLNMVPLNYVNWIETSSYFNRKSFEVWTVLNFEDYFIPIYWSVWWINKQRINNADILSQEFEVYTPESVFVFYLWTKILNYRMQTMARWSWIEKKFPRSKGCSLYTANTANTLQYDVLVIHALYGFRPYLTVTTYSPRCAEQAVKWLILVMRTQCVFCEV
jgi:hypothetical protein